MPGDEDINQTPPTNQQTVAPETPNTAIFSNLNTPADETEGTPAHQSKGHDQYYYEKEIRSLNTKLNNISSSLDQERIRIIEALGIFVALFTFVSVNIQIFSRVTSLGNAIIFIFLIFLCMAGFVFVLHTVLNLSHGLKGSIPSILGLLLIIAAALCFALYFRSHEDIPLSVEEDSKTTQLENRTNILEKRVDDLVIQKR